VLAHGRGWAHFGLGEPAAARRQFLEFARLTQQLRVARGPQREISLRLALEYFEQPWADAVMRRPTGILPRRTETALDLELCAEALHCCCHVASAADLSEDLLEHAAALRTLAEAGASPPRRAEALAWLGTHALAVGRARHARQALDEALALSRALEHGRALCVALSQRARLYLLQGQLASAQASFEELHARVPDARGAADSLTQLGEVHAERGEPALALRAHASADVLRQRSLPGFPALHGWLLRELGQLDAARRLDETALERLERTAPEAVVSRLHASLASTACRQGDLPAARRHAAAAEALVPAARRECSFRMGRIWVARSQLLAAQGAWEESATLGRRWLVSARARADAGGVRAARRCLALALLNAGEPRRALRQVRQALAVAAAHPLPLSDWRSHALEAHIALHLGDPAAARSARQLASERLGALARRLDTRGERLCVAQLADAAASL
jgi:tetratricopeptide (TPR) repeat protein